MKTSFYVNLQKKGHFALQQFKLRKSLLRSFLVIAVRSGSYMFLLRLAKNMQVNKKYVC